MRRIVKKEVDQNTLSDGDSTKKTPSKKWKFYNAMLFMKKDIDKDLEKEKVKGEKEMTNEEKAIPYRVLQKYTTVMGHKPKGIPCPWLEKSVNGKVVERVRWQVYH